MAFFLIVPSVIIVSIILIHGVASYMGVKISYGALFVCAALSFVALFGAIELSPNPDKFFFVHLGAIILPAALIVTALNYFLIVRDKDKEADFTEEVRRVYAQQSNGEIYSSEIAKERLKNVSAQVDKNSTADKNSKAEKISDDDKTFNTDKNFDNEIFETEKIFDGDKTFDEILDAEKSLSIEFDTLEDLLEYAQAEKVQGHITAAIVAYQKALDEYRNDDYAPFIAVDLSAMYREQAAYTKAIEVYEDALTLPAVKKNSAVTAEFKKKLAYIKTVQAILFKHNALSTPFSKISREHLREIEFEFKENSNTENS